MENEEEILTQLRKRDIKAFKALINEFAEDMEILAFILLEDHVRANDLVANLLVNLWAKDALKEAELPLRLYLFSEVKKACALL